MQRLGLGSFILCLSRPSGASGDRKWHGITFAVVAGERRGREARPIFSAATPPLRPAYID